MFYYILLLWPRQNFEALTSDPLQNSLASTAPGTVYVVVDRKLLVLVDKYLILVHISFQIHTSSLCVPCMMHSRIIYIVSLSSHSFTIEDRGPGDFATSHGLNSSIGFYRRPVLHFCLLPPIAYQSLQNYISVKMWF